MIRCHTILRLVLLCLTAATGAEAQYKFCNEGPVSVYVAFGYFEGQWTSEGWWTIEPGECATVYSGELARRNYFYYAKTTTGGFEWKGNHVFCTRPARAAGSAGFSGPPSGAADPTEIRFAGYHPRTTKQRIRLAVAPSCGQPEDRGARGRLTAPLPRDHAAESQLPPLLELPVWLRSIFDEATVTPTLC